MQLRVVVRVDVDEAGRHRQPVRVKPLARLAVETPDCGDAAVLYRDVGGDRGCAGAVDDAAGPDEQVPHQRNPYMRKALVP